ncbi:Required for respiratory growth protein 9 [Penicillium angulare]|uniref:Required for respiratory growth protein 9 n=1 Tax=Penicillium angulare TaxID=116970 RepID=UPI0025401BED|nr:Required for respiratory growth protein 9 [Penicillium angulare]KAJ5281817.1 Required for respiratory growth protein 9 [Penicillium angulare]
MATKCATPASLALPRALHRFFCSELPHSPRPSLFVRYSRTLQQARQISSSRFHHDQEQSHRAVSDHFKTSDIKTSVKSSHTSFKSPSDSTTKPHRTPKAGKDRKTAKDTDKKWNKINKLNQEPKVKMGPEDWQIQKQALSQKFPAGWNPSKKLSPDALDGIRQLHASAPEQFTTAVLAEEFKISPESIRRILKSKWRPSGEEVESRRKRWEKRHERIWSHMAELGLRPMTKSSLPWADSQTLYKDNGEGEGEGEGESKK